jgi:hypothetical protein
MSRGPVTLALLGFVLGSALVLVFVLPLPVASAAAATADATLDEMVEINRKALDELRLGKHEAARDDLLRALNMGKRAGLGAHQMMARTYLHLGAVYLTGFGDRDRAFHQLVSAVKIRPNIQITPQLLTPSLQETFEQARVQVVGAPRPAPSNLAKADPPPPEKVAVVETPPPPPPRAPDPAPRAIAPEVEVTAPAEVAPRRPSSAAPPAFWIGLGLGSGLGWHGRRDLETQTDFFVPAGVAAAALVHLSPEIGYRFDRRTAVSLQSRHQIIPTTGRVATAIRPRSAHAIFLRAHRLLLPFSDQLELWGTAAVGVGSAIRLYVPERPVAGLDASDTLDVGPVAFGPGASLVYHLSPHLSLLAELRAMAAVSRFAVLADLSVGAGYSF